MLKAYSFILLFISRTLLAFLTCHSSVYNKRFLIIHMLMSFLILSQPVIDFTFIEFQVCKIFNVIITSLLPYSVFLFTHKVFKCRLLAFLACTFTVTERHLAVFGARTLVNSFTSPFIFFALYLCLPSETTNQHKPKRHTQTANDQHVHRTNIRNNMDSVQVGADVGIDRNSSDDSGGNLQSCSSARKRIPPMKMHDTNNNMNNKPDIVSFYSNRDVDVCCSEKFKYGRFHGQISGTSLATKAIGGVILGLVCYIRIDTLIISAMIYVSLIFTNSSTRWHKFISTMSAASGGLLSVIFGVLYDVTRYGDYVITPIQWFRFNVMSGQAQILFAFMRRTGYWKEFVTDLNFIIFVVLSAIVFIYYLFIKPNQSSPINFGRSRYIGKGCVLLISFVFTVFIYSIIGHTEIRFIHNCFVLASILLGISVHHTCWLLSEMTRNKTIGYLAVCITILTSCMLCITSFPSADDKTIHNWTYGKAKESRDVNICLEFLGQQSDVTGVVIASDLYDIAGFTSFNHNVPIIVKVYNEYRVYETRKRNEYGIASSIRLVDNYADFLHTSNDAYLSKLLSKDNVYNYVVSTSKFFKPEYKFVYRHLKQCGQFSLYTRKLSEKHIQEMMNISRNLPVGNNATVLEYEVSWLMTNALYDKAIERVKRALEINQTRVRLYQQLIVCYVKLRKSDLVAHANNQCISRFGRQKCSTPQPKVVLHDDYTRFK